MILEFSQLLLRSEEEFNSRLDKACAEHAQVYQEELRKAERKHDKVREGAELELTRLVLEEELRQMKREEERQRELERIKAEKAKQESEARQRVLEAKRREEEAARKAAEEQRQIQEAEARARAQKEREEMARRQKAEQEEAARKAREKAAAAQKAQAQAPQQPALQKAVQVPITAPAAQPTGAIAIGASDVEEIHSRYLELHQRMKAFWKPFKTECAQKGHPFKGPVGDLRRELRKITGQVTVERADSKVVISKIRELLRSTAKIGGPTVDIRSFIISRPLPTLSHESEAQYPAILLYAFICFEKFVIKQFDSEAAKEESGIIQELGVIAASLFVDKEFVWKGIPMIDLLLAKLHRACPILFGITGNPNTPEGRARLGWTNVGGSPMNVNYYHQRMVGLANGFAAMSLRAVAAPAIPISEHWRALASICNTPSDQLYTGHFMVLKGLVRDSAKKIIMYYGAQGRALLRHATIVMPTRAPARAKDTASLVSVYPDVWKAAGISLQ